jgi:gamma-glutamyltranspeptidase / glutathione hydrolase
MTFTTRPELCGDFGMVASSHYLATAAGMATLEAGGNAFDAAAAAGFVLQVVEPHLNGPLGDMPAVIYDAAADRVRVICGQGGAPAAASVDHFAGLGLAKVPGDGLLSAVVPGAFGGWMMLLRDYGTYSVRDVLEAAIGYAAGGFPLSAGAADAIAGIEGLLREHWTTSAEVWLPGGALPRPGQRFRNPALAALYRRVADEAEAAGSGRDAQLEAASRAWYQGFVAEAIDAYLAHATPVDITGERHRGLLTGADMAGWQPHGEDTLTGRLGAWTVHKTGPWGQGPVFLQQLALLDGTDPGEPGSARWVHRVVEGAKLALADRDAWYGDPDFTPDLTGQLLDPGYVAARRELIGEQASLELRPGSPGGAQPRTPKPGTPPAGGGWLGGPQGMAGQWRPGAPGGNGGTIGEPTLGGPAAWRRVPGDTVHLDVADRWGNLVSATPSRGWLQSSPAIPGLGCCLNTTAQTFTLEPGLPNTLAPGKRPRSTLSPGLAVSDDGERLAFGTPGGDLQDQWSLAFFLRYAAGGGNMAEAIDAPMFHTGHFLGSFYPHVAHLGVLAAEERLGGDVIGDLRARGHDVKVRPDWTLGRVTAVASGGRRGFLRAACSPRGGDGYAAGRLAGASRATAIRAIE